jgi:hypothetical protein
MPLHFKKCYFLPSCIKICLFYIQLLYVSAFPIGNQHAIGYIKHKYVYREKLFASSQIYIS